MKELGDHIFDCGGVEDAGKFVKSKDALMNYIRMTGEQEASYVADSLKHMLLEGPPRPPRPPQIPDPDKNADADAMIDDEIEILIWQGDLRNFAKRRNGFVEGAKKAYATIWDMCSPTLRSKLKHLDGYEVMEELRNPVTLMEAVGNIICGREEHKQPIYSLVQLQKMLVLFYQKKNQTNEDYKEEFDALWSTYEQQGGCMWKQPGLVHARAVELATENNRAADANGIPEPNDDDVAEAEEWVRMRYKAAMMLSGADNKRYGSLKNYLENRLPHRHVPAPGANEALQGREDVERARGAKRRRGRRRRTQLPTARERRRRGRTPGRRISSGGKFPPEEDQRAPPRSAAAALA